MANLAHVSSWANYTKIEENAGHCAQFTNMVKNKVTFIPDMTSIISLVVRGVVLHKISVCKTPKNFETTHITIDITLAMLAIKEIFLTRQVIGAHWPTFLSIWAIWAQLAQFKTQEPNTRTKLRLLP